MRIIPILVIMDKSIAFIFIPILGMYYHHAISQFSISSNRLYKFANVGLIARRESSSAAASFNLSPL